MVCNWFATDISPFRHYNGGTFIDPQVIQGGAGENKIRTKIAVDKGSNWQFNNLFIEHQFIWQSDRVGLMNTVAWLNFIGAWYMFSPGSCWSTAGAKITIGADLSVAQHTSGTNTLILTGAEETILDVERETHCAGTVWTGIPAELRSGDVELTRNNYPIQNNKPVLATINMSIQISAYNGAEAYLDFYTDSSYHYNVPSVWHIIDS
ncbi:MAG: hypothetical protein DRJ10_03465 [Bacteroidetes bacterium]|nr:MAG: hypothetical protein DRJ10_03465 [Bacteroidota bacterium]